MLYTERSVKSTFRELLVFAIADVILLAVGIYFAFDIGLGSSETAGCIVLIVTMFAVIFVLGNFVMPCFHYYIYLSELMTGRHVTRTGTVVSVGEKSVYKDNKNYYYEIDVRFEDGKCGMYLYDANIGKPTVRQDDNVEVLSYENFILSVTVR